MAGPPVVALYRLPAVVTQLVCGVNEMGPPAVQLSLEGWARAGKCKTNKRLSSSNALAVKFMVFQIWT